MNGVSDTARALAREAIIRKDAPGSYGDRALDAAYPTIRNNVIEEIATALRLAAPSASGLSPEAAAIAADFIDHLKDHA